MPVYTLNVFAPTLNPFWSNTSESPMYNVSGSSNAGSFSAVEIQDDDGLLSDNIANSLNGTAVDSSQQVLNGTSTPVQGFFHIDIYNATTGEFGKAFLLTTGAGTQSVSNALGWVFTTPVNAGDTIDWLATANVAGGGPDGFAWGEVAYADLIPPDYIVEGTAGDDIIDDAYAGDPEGDFVDNNDALNGSNDDLIEAYGGNDSVSAGDGDDIVYAGTGDDTVDAGVGDDTVYGGDGDDNINGGDGNDTIEAGADNDSVMGGSGDDSILGGEGNDVLRGDGTNEQIAGDGDFDGDYGFSGNNTIENLPNPIEGIFDGSSSTTIDYRHTESQLGDFANVDSSGEGGFLRFIAASASREVVGINTSTPLLAGETYTFTLDAAVAGNPFTNSLTETDGTITLYGHATQGAVGSGYNLPTGAVTLGSITITTTDPMGDGDSRTLDTYTITFTPTQDIESLYLQGSSVAFPAKNYFVDNLSVTNDAAAPIVPGNDTIDGGFGDDEIYGEGGNDSLSGGADNDTLFGGSGDDVLSGDAGTNVVTGGEGNDTFVYTAGETLDITDFGVGSTDPDDGDSTNNDFVDLTAYYTNQAEFEADMADDGIANQSVGDFSDNTSMAGGEITGLSSLVGISATSLAEQTGITCFTRGTRILTPNGDVLIEDLKIGSRVETLDHGPQTIRWIGSTRRSARGNCAPVRIRAGTLGNNRDLWVSQQHRMVLRGARAELLFGKHEVLAPAKSLVNDCTVRIVEGGEVEYFHILFDNHEIVYAEGAMTESLHLGKQSFDALSQASIEEIEMLFPELKQSKGKPLATARPVLKHFEARVLLHVESNSKQGRVN